MRDLDLNGDRVVVVVDVSDFGADPTGTSCSAAAVAAAIASVRGRRASIRFPHGRYAFHQEGAQTRELYVSNTVGPDQRHRDKRIGILIEGADGLILDGDGSTFVFGGTQTTIAILDSTDVTLRDFELDFARPTVVDATVVAAGVERGRAYREISVPECTAFRVDGTHVVWLGETAPDGLPYWEMTDAGEYCQVRDADTPRTVRLTDPVFAEVHAVQAQGRRIRIEYGHDRVPDDLGRVYQYRHTTRDHPGMAVIDSTRTRLERLQVRYLHGFGVVVQNGRDLAVHDCVFEPPAGTGRVTAGFADFLQCSGVSGRIDVQRTTFSGAHDDPINVHGTYLRVVDATARDELVLEYAHPETAGFEQFAEGDVLEIVDADLLRPIGEQLTVVSVVQPTGRDHALDLERLLVRVRPELPEIVRTSGARLAVENVSRTPDVVIEGCRFSGIPTRGILVSTRGTVRIADSVFERMPMPSIFISADAEGWWESGPVRDVVIEGNRFVEPGDTPLGVEPSVIDADERYPVHGRIVFRDNEVQASGDLTLVRARSVAELQVTGTKLPLGVIGVIETEAVARLVTDRS